MKRINVNVELYFKVIVIFHYSLVARTLIVFAIKISQILLRTLLKLKKILSIFFCPLGEPATRLK